MHKHKIIAASILLALLGMASFAFRQAPKPGKPKNLKVLPKNIDHSSLIKIMHDFAGALNVKCMFCHEMSKTKPGDMDFASDAKPTKNRARSMMKMMMKINRKFFKVRGNFLAAYPDDKITCYSCHHGSEHPMKMAPFNKMQMGPGRFPPPPGQQENHPDNH